MRIFICVDALKRKVIGYWLFLGFILLLLFFLKECIVLVDIHTDELAWAVNPTVSGNNPFRIYVNLDSRTMYVYKDNTLYKTYKVSGGKENSPSPLGDWTIIHKDTWGDGFGGVWMELNVPWGKYGIHGTRPSWSWAIGKQNVSGGCIRMNNEDAKELFDFIPYGTNVSIVFENQPFRNLKEGDIGSDVYQVQRILKKLGYFQNECNGKYGSETKEAVRKYQKHSNLAETGSVNITTWNKLMETRDLQDNLPDPLSCSIVGKVGFDFFDCG